MGDCFVLTAWKTSLTFQVSSACIGNGQPVYVCRDEDNNFETCWKWSLSNVDQASLLVLFRFGVMFVLFIVGQSCFLGVFIFYLFRFVDYWILSEVSNCRGAIKDAEIRSSFVMYFLRSILWCPIFRLAYPLVCVVFFADQLRGLSGCWMSKTVVLNDCLLLLNDSSSLST